MMIVADHTYEAWCGWFGIPGFLSVGDYKTYSRLGEYVHRAMQNLVMGVDIFFLISGFLITYLLLIEKEKTGRIHFKNFFIRRFLRILPLYYFLILITPMLIRWLGEASPDYMSSIFFYNNFHTIFTEKWTYPFAHFWSICIEEHFYLFWPFVIALVPVNRLIRVFCLIIFASILFRVYQSLFNPYPWYTIFLHTLSRIDMLSIGAIAAYVHFTKGIKPVISVEIRIMVYTIFVILFFSDTIVAWDNVFLACLKKYFYGGVAGLAMIHYQFGRKRLLPLFSNKLFNYFGKISYGIYMYGNIIILIIVKKIMIDFDIHNMYVFISLVLLFSLLIPMISYELFEKQLLKFKRKFEVIKTST